MLKPQFMFENCTVKYHRNIHSGIVDGIQVFYPKTKDKDGNDTGITMGIPMDEDNTDYQNILEWEKIEGNVIEEAD
tara:strand:+ start:298 stop:525 length:228 start_codon:yes stop_codon:yes gene_type:complete